MVIRYLLFLHTGLDRDCLWCCQTTISTGALFYSNCAITCSSVGTCQSWKMINYGPLLLDPGQPLNY